MTMGRRQLAPPLPRSPVAGVLREIAVGGLLANIVLLVVAMALGGVEGNVGRAAGALVALVILGDRRNSLRHHGLRYQRKEPTPAATKSFPGTTAWPRRRPSVAAGGLNLLRGSRVRIPSETYFQKV